MRCPAQSGSPPAPARRTRDTRVGCSVACRRLRTAGQALLALLDNTVLARSRTHFALTILRHVVPGARALKSTRGEASDIVSSLFQSLEGGPASVGTRQPEAARGVQVDAS